MKKKDPDNVTLHKECVRGVVEVILYIFTPERKSCTFAELNKVGGKGKSELAASYISEFIKDGVINLKKENVERVLSGDYSSIWSSTNSYLKRFGHSEVSPQLF